MNHKNKKARVWLVLGVIFVVVAVVAGIILVKQVSDRNKADRSFADLQDGINAGDDEPETTEDNITEEATEDIDILAELGIEIPEKMIDWDALHEECEDIYAWVYVPDTDVDYPVLQHPTDDSYYLNYNMDGSKGLPGCIYTEATYTAKDFSDIHTVIYGHNLKDGTMFSTLHNFENEELFNEDHYIFIYTEDYTFVYRIFAVYEYKAIHLLANFDYTNEYVYEDYLKGIYSTSDPIANVRQDIEVTTENQILTLSTCTSGSNYDENMRFLVTGVLLNPRED
jgi:sortase B